MIPSLLPATPPAAPLAVLLDFHKSIRLALGALETTAGLASAGLADVIRVSALVDFFDGPLRWHDEDEALSLFPRLLRSDPERARAVVAAVARDHAIVEDTLDTVVVHLRAIADGAAPDADKLAAWHRALHDVVLPHLRREEEDVFPLAAQLLDASAQKDMATEMHARRLRRLARC